MTAATLLDRLDAVRQTGPGQWLARCPAHDDKQPSLSMRDLPDGRTLIHCFAGCAAADVLHAVGLDFDDLHPPRAIDHHRPPERRAFAAADILRACAAEALVTCIIAQSLADGRKLGEEDRLRLVTASSRLLAAVDAAGLDPDGARIYRSLVKSRAAVIDLAAERATTNAKRVGGKFEATSEAEHA